MITPTVTAPSLLAVNPIPVLSTACNEVQAVTIPEAEILPSLPTVVAVPVGAPTFNPPRAVTIPVESTLVTSSDVVIPATVKL